MTALNVVGYRPQVSRAVIGNYMRKYNVGLREAKHMAIKVQLSIDIGLAKDVNELKPMLLYVVRVLHKELSCDIRD